MRLLNARSFAFEEFFGEEVPVYAILSHCWSKEEVSFREFRKVFETKKVPLSTIEQREGYQKIVACAKVTLNHKIDWIWIDTICINKDSSAELSEAINSMYRWYHDAKTCFAHLADVQAPFDNDNFRKSRWFTRGWTLQELLAPKSVEFYDQNWKCLGTRTALEPEIAALTGIGFLYLDFGANAASVAQKMSWMAHRSTRRPEDIAYCMLGLFDVNMPLLYGEGGKKAFVRLQIEILKKSNDESILAWTIPIGQGTGDLLADSPECFEGGGRIKNLAGYRRREFTSTTQGLTISGPFWRGDQVIRISKDGTLPISTRGQQVVAMPLACKNADGLIPVVYFKISNFGDMFQPAWRCVSTKLSLLDKHPSRLSFTDAELTKLTVWQRHR